MAGSSKKVIFAALIGNAVIAVAKFVMAAITGSSAMFSEGRCVADICSRVWLVCF
jgi:divalent metal cation (Fe/Co/Zn/Cd) transporter